MLVVLVGSFMLKNLVKSLKMCIFNSSVGLLVGLTAKLTLFFKNEEKR